jgi:hypothetical protein
MVPHDSSKEYQNKKYNEVLTDTVLISAVKHFCNVHIVTANIPQCHHM